MIFQISERTRIVVDENLYPKVERYSRDYQTNSPGWVEGAENHMAIGDVARAYVAAKLEANNPAAAVAAERAAVVKFLRDHAKDSDQQVAHELREKADKIEAGRHMP